MNSVHPIHFCRTIISTLKKVDKRGWAKIFVDAKMEFARQYTKGFIFSTRFGMSFFEDVLYHLESRQLLTAEKGQKLGEYDQNFNLWLKKILNIH